MVTDNGPYHYLDAVRVHFDAMRKECFATIAAALKRAEKDSMPKRGARKELGA